MSSRRAREHLDHFVRTPKISYVCRAQFLPEHISIVHIARIQQDGDLLAAVSIEQSVLSTYLLLTYLLAYLLIYSIEQSPS